MNKLFSAFLNASNIQALLLTNIELSITPANTATPTCSPNKKKPADMSINRAENFNVPLRTESLDLFIVTLIEFFCNSYNRKPKTNHSQ